eukprot:c11863_g1_i1 orf=1-162(-)
MRRLSLQGSARNSFQPLLVRLYAAIDSSLLLPCRMLMLVTSPPLVAVVDLNLSL